MTPFVSDPDFTLYVGDVLDVLRELPDESVHCCVTSPPYWGLRDYGVDGQLGLEPTPDEYAAAMVGVFAEVRRVLRTNGTLWLNIGDSYVSAPSGSKTVESKLGKSGLHFSRATLNDAHTRARIEQANAVRGQWHVPPGLKQKDLVGIPWRLAFALQADGWYLRSDIIWSKPNPMPESVTDRPTKAHEYLFLLTKSARYFYDADAIREPAEWARWGDQTVGPGSMGWMQPKTKAELSARKSDAAGVNGRNVQATNPESERRDTVGGSFNNNPRLRADVGRNKRTVWEIATESYAEAHFATFPQALVEPCIKAGCPAGGIVLDPFMGSGTTALVARRLGRRSIGIELNEEYARLAAKRLQQLSLLALDEAA